MNFAVQNFSTLNKDFIFYHFSVFAVPQYFSFSTASGKEKRKEKTSHTS